MKILFAFSAAVLLATPVQAQLAPGQSGYSSAPRAGVEPEYWNFLDQVGPCLANQKPDQAMALIDAPIDSAAESAAFDTLFNVGENRRNNCLGRLSGVHGAQRAHIRASVAEGLFQQLPDETIERFIAQPPSAPDAINTLHDFAYCFAVTHPVETRELLSLTDVASGGELEYVRQIAGDFAECLPQDREVKLNATSVRMSLAEAAFRAASGRPAATIEGRD